MNIECRVCKESKDPQLMKNLYGKPCKICRKCDGKERAKRYSKKPRSRGRKDRINAKIRNKLKNNIDLDFFLYKTSRKNDKIKGRDNNLTREFIKAMISKPCKYCSKSYARMGLDRINNKIGHLQTNVVTCCIRCNYIRRDMPYEAWAALVPAVKEITEQGLFGDWTGAWKLTSSDFGKINRSEFNTEL
jgi:hypothetical protein